MKLLNLLLFSLVLYSCSSGERFGLTQKYRLSDDEKSIPINQIIVDKYESVINIDTFNIPLNRAISALHHKTYIGVSFNASKETLYNKYASTPEYNIFDQRISNDTTEFIFKTKERFFNSLIYFSKKDKFTYVITLESDSAYVAEKFNTYFLSHKVRNEK